MRASSCDVFTSPAGFYYLVVSPACSESTYIVTVDTTSGNPFYTGVPFVDVFPDRSMAFKTLTEAGAAKAFSGGCLIGLRQSDKLTTIAIVTKAEVTGELPGGHKIYTVRDTAFVNIALPGCTVKNSLVEEFQLNNNHFYCESYDATRLFPNDSKGNPDKGFVWNNGWKKPFELLGIPHVCMDLIQGVCRSSSFKKFDFQITYIARRSVLNPGTRYAARGLNDLNSPGNEVECELIFVRGEKFWSVRWRRGSIPIRWKTTLTSSLASPQHKVDKDYFQGTQEYFEGLQERFGDDLPIRCVSLLQTEEDHAEQEIKSYFSKAVERLFDAGIDKVFYTPFDLNHHLHADGSSEAMMDFVSFIGPLADEDGFNYGTLPLSVEQKQRGLMRFNCADSLDRTNLATFYFAMKITAEWCLAHNIGVVDAKADRNLPNKIISQEIIDFLAVAFVDSGNVISFLYTNTPAIKVKAIRNFSSSVEKQSSDTSVTMQRRVQNVMNDPQRMKVIGVWTDPPDLKWYHRVDPRYLVVVPGEKEIPRAILSTAVKPFKLSSAQNELLVCFPCPMQLFSLIILLYPTQFNATATRMTVSVGMSLEEMSVIGEIGLPIVSSPLWCRYRFGLMERWALGNSVPERYGRFVSLKFDVTGDSYCLGNVKFETRSVFSGLPDLRPPPQPELDEESVKRFDISFDAFMQSKKTPKDVIELEKARLAIKIPERHREELALKAGMNPWLADADGQLRAAPSYCCLACGKNLSQVEETTVYNFKQHPVVKGLFTKADLRSSIRICADCMEFAEGVSQMTDIYVDEVKPQSVGIPHFEAGNPKTDLLQRNQAVTFDSNAVVLNDRNTIVWEQEGSVKLEANESKDFELFVVQQAIVLQFLVRSSSSKIRLTSKGCSETPQEVEPGRYTFVFTEQPITQRLKFTVQAGDEPAEISQIQLLYIITEFPLETPELMKQTPPVTTKPNSPIGYYSAQKRTDLFKFPKGTLKRFQLEVVVDKNVPVPISFIVACYQDDTFVHAEHFIMPEAPNGSVLWYTLSQGVVCNSMKIFYVDRLTMIKQHNVRIHTE